MNKSLRLFIFALFFLYIAQATSPLQLFIDFTPGGQTLRPIPGVYEGPVVIRKAIIFDGGGEVTIDGKGSGTVLTILADSTVVRNVHIINSGESHDQVNAGILIEADYTVVERNTLENVLFGIHIKSGFSNQVLQNDIRSIQASLTLRGEGIRLWNCQSNIIKGNTLSHVRDVVLTNSPYNYFIDNLVEDSRIGIELIYSPSCTVEGNIFQRNEHGIIGLYSDSLMIKRNRIQHQDKLRGTALAVKGSSQILIQENEILDCAVGLTANAPIFPENIIILNNNTFAFNDVAIYLYGDRGGHVMYKNIFKGNFQHVVVTHPSAAVDNDWLGNYWDDYTGFDLNNDGVGDHPYSSYLYSERLWMDRDMARFFRGTPLLEMIDFMERLAPFLDPPLVLQDEQPQTKYNSSVINHPAGKTSSER